MNSSLFRLFGIAFAIAFVNGLPLTTAPSLSTVITQFCAAVSTEPTLANVYYTESTALLNQNDKVEQKFPQTLAYINNSTNKKEFIAGGTSCQQYFVGLKIPLVADLTATGLSTQQVAQQIQQYVEQTLGSITAVVKALKK